MDEQANEYTKELEATIDALTQEHLDDTFQLTADAVYDLEAIEQKMRAQLKKVTDRLDNNFDDILAKLDEAERKIMELPEDTDIQQWLIENPEYDPKNMAKLQQQAKTASSENDFKDIMKEVGKLGEKKNGPHMDELERVFAEQVAKLDELKASIDGEMNIDALRQEL